MLVSACFGQVRSPAWTLIPWSPVFTYFGTFEQLFHFYL